MVDFSFKVNVFEIDFRYYVHFRMNTHDILGKDMSPLHPLQWFE